MQLLIVPDSLKESLSTIEGSINPLYQEGFRGVFAYHQNIQTL
jgi:glycerate kinase